MNLHNLFESINARPNFNIGDPVIITGNVEFRGKTGDVKDFNRDGSFVVVDLYNYGPRSFHVSDVSRNDYADSEDEEDVAEGLGGVSVRQWANQVRKDHGVDVKFRNRQEGGGAVDMILAINSQGETVGVYNRKTGFPTVYEPKQDVAEGGILKSIKRGLKGWQGSSHLDDIQDYIRNASDKTLVRLYKEPGESPYKQTPRDIQIKLINRELKRRYGIKPGEPGVAEGSVWSSADQKMKHHSEFPHTHTAAKDIRSSMSGKVIVPKGARLSALGNDNYLNLDTGVQPFKLDPANLAKQDVAEGEQQVYKVVALDKSNALKKPTNMKVKADSIEDLFGRLAANDWYPLEINGVEVINGKRLKKQGVAEGKSLQYTVVVRGNDFSYSKLADALTDGHPHAAKVFKNGNLIGTIGLLSKQGVAEGSFSPQEYGKQLQNKINQDAINKASVLKKQKQNLGNKIIANTVKQQIAKKGVSEGSDSEDFANEVYAEFERMYPNLARRANERTVHAAVIDVLNYGGDNNPAALAQDVARAVKRNMQGVAEEKAERAEKNDQPWVDPKLKRRMDYAFGHYAGYRDKPEAFFKWVMNSIDHSEQTDQQHDQRFERIEQEIEQLSQRLNQVNEQHGSAVANRFSQRLVEHFAADHPTTDPTRSLFVESRTAKRAAIREIFARQG